MWVIVFFILTLPFLCSFSVFKPEELRQALMPTLESLYRQDPESLPFRQPVDPMLLGIPVGSTHALASSCFYLKQKLLNDDSCCSWDIGFMSWLVLVDTHHSAALFLLFVHLFFLYLSFSL